jgi:putative GTP pyrophosphokinase
MSAIDNVDKNEIALVKAIVAQYKTHGYDLADRDGINLAIHFQSKRLAELVHSMKTRAKDPAHLEDKLFRKLKKSKEIGAKPFDVTPDNLFEKVTDLAGVRLLHLHTSQFPKINEILQTLLLDEGYSIIEGPEARTWDDEYRAIFESHGIATVPSKRLYTSVHYVVQTSGRSKRTAEIQVRTLAEELWGEVDHAINYPHPTPIHACQEQIKVLARLTSSCTRLVDSIFSSKGVAEDATKSIESR